MTPTSSFPLLSLITFLPLFGALIIIALRGEAAAVQGDEGGDVGAQGRGVGDPELATVAANAFLAAA